MPISDKKLGVIVISFLLTFICCICVVFVWVTYVQPKVFTVKFERIGNLKIDDAIVQNGLMIGRVKSILWRGDLCLIRVETVNQPRMYSNYSIADIEKGVMGDRMIMVSCGDSSHREISWKDTLQGIFVPGISEDIAYAGRLHKIIKEMDSCARLLRYGAPDRHSLIREVFDLVNSTDTFTARLSAAAMQLSLRTGPGLNTMRRALKNFSGIMGPVIRKGPGQLSGINTCFDSLAVITEKLHNSVDSAQRLLENLNGTDSLLRRQRADNLLSLLADIRQALDFISQSGLLLRVGVSLH